MKNTKKLLITGAALGIALFASVQVTAMEQRINRLKADLNRYEERLDPKEIFMQFEAPQTIELIRQVRAELKALEIEQLKADINEYEKTMDPQTTQMLQQALTEKKAELKRLEAGKIFS